MNKEYKKTKNEFSNTNKQELAEKIINFKLSRILLKRPKPASSTEQQ
jgi:hypothetical protein